MMMMMMMMEGWAGQAEMVGMRLHRCSAAKELHHSPWVLGVQTLAEAGNHHILCMYYRLTRRYVRHSISFILLFLLFPCLFVRDSASLRYTNYYPPSTKTAHTNSAY
eukprot:gene619-341_t